MQLETVLTTVPDPSEHAPYYGKYVALVAGGNVLDTLERQCRETLSLLRSLTEEQGAIRYEPSKWSIRQVIGHVNDTERIFAYRALRISRGDRTPIEGFEPDPYAAQGPSDSVPLAVLAAEFETVRRGTLALFRQLGAEAWLRRGIASNNEVSVHALAWITAGHEVHHRTILRERYLA